MLLTQGQIVKPSGVAMNGSKLFSSRGAVATSLMISGWLKSGAP